MVVSKTLYITCLLFSCSSFVCIPSILIKFIMPKVEVSYWLTFCLAHQMTVYSQFLDTFSKSCGVVDCFNIHLLISLRTNLPDVQIHYFQKSKSYWGPSWTSMVEYLAKIVNSWRPQGNFAKISTIDVWQGPKYKYEDNLHISFLLGK